jgi:hypothetical protein
MICNGARLITYVFGVAFSRLRCEVEVSFAPSVFDLPLNAYSYDQITAQNGPLPALDEADADILRIRAYACADSALVSADMSVKDICSLLEKLASSLSALDNWHSRLTPSLDFTLSTSLDFTNSSTPGNDARLRMQYLYYEAKELILRPTLFLLLHSQPIHEEMLTATTGEEVGGVFEHMLGAHVVAQLREMNERHRECLIIRSRLCLNAISTSPRASEIGWLKRQTCFTLALLLIASSRVESHAVGLTHMSDSVAAVNQTINFLANDALCGESSKVSAAILRSCRSEDDNGAALLTSMAYR